MTQGRLHVRHTRFLTATRKNHETAVAGTHPGRLAAGAGAGPGERRAAAASWRASAAGRLERRLLGRRLPRRRLLGSALRLAWRLPGLLGAARRRLCRLPGLLGNLALQPGLGP